MRRTSAWRGISLIFLMTGLVGAQEEHALSDSTVFQLFIEKGKFDNAEQGCADLNEGNSTFDFTLARIDSDDEFNFIIGAFDLENLQLTQTFDNVNQRSSIWIGLKRSSRVSPAGPTEEFSFLDGIEIGRSFFQAPNTFPWASSQPNNIGGSQDCVSWEIELEKNSDLPFRWYDDNCNLDMSAFLCRGEIIPTALPTSSPSIAPTPAPSDSPTLKPTDSPSLAPTLEPTDSPSSSPTLEPTDAPQAAEAAGPPDDKDSLVNTIFLFVAGISGMLMLLLLLIILREKRDLKVLRQALNDIELKETLSELGTAFETHGLKFRL